jgi:Zn-dependent protease with chaperone function
MPSPLIENRLPDEGINTSKEHPLRELVWLLGAALVGFGLVLAGLTFLAGWLAPNIPFQHEQALAQRLGIGTKNPLYGAQDEALQQLVNRLVVRMDLPQGMDIRVRLEPSDQVNAYATIGGHVVVYAGLLKKLASEEALAALLAHEMAHVKHRHVAASAGRGLAISLALTLLSADAGGAVAQSVFGLASQAALMSYSREHETQADADALAAMIALYGHGAGYLQLFETLQKTESDIPDALRSAGFMRSHPLTEDRLQAAHQLARQNGWSLQGPFTALPAALKDIPEEKSSVRLRQALSRPQ